MPIGSNSGFDLAAQMAGPERDIVEAGVAGTIAGAGDLRLLLRSATAYREPAARIICQKLETALPPLKLLIGRVEVALQEAIANAVLHGNWRLGSEHRTLDDFAVFCDLIAAKLEDPLSAALPVLIAITWNNDDWLSCEITDQGDGFVASDPAGTSLAHGRGFALMAQNATEVAWDNPRRTLRLRFRRN